MSTSLKERLKDLLPTNNANEASRSSNGAMEIGGNGTTLPKVEGSSLIPIAAIAVGAGCLLMAWNKSKHQKSAADQEALRELILMQRDRRQSENYEEDYGDN